MAGVVGYAQKVGRVVRVLVGCEESQVVTAAFRKRGHEAYSCDLQGGRINSEWHITGDVFKAIKHRGPWDMMIVFPPCTYVTVANARHITHGCSKYTAQQAMLLQREALEFMRDLIERDIPKIAMENPIGVFSSYWRKPDQIIQPWMFGHRETKATCLWLKNLPPLVPTCIVGPPVTEEEKRGFAKVHRMAPGPERQRNRSVTYQGIAEAMADQWG